MLLKNEKKQQLIEELKKKHLFWSYNLSNNNTTTNLPDELVIEQTLFYADVDDILLLFIVFDKKQIKSIWRAKVIPDTRFYARNYYLAKIFFNIKNPQRYILPLQKKFSRYEKLKSLIALN